MEEPDETFQISVEINRGLEPLTLTVTVYNNPSAIEGQELLFKITRDRDILCVLTPDTNHYWKQVEGNINQDEVDDIGAAIDGHYA